MIALKRFPPLRDRMISVNDKMMAMVMFFAVDVYKRQTIRSAFKPSDVAALEALAGKLL